MSARMFGRGTVATPATDAPVEVATDATYNARGWAGVMFVGGALACLVPPVAPLGAFCAVFGGVVWLLAPATEPAAQQMVVESSVGGGCGAALAAVGLVVGIVALAGLLAMGAGVALNGGL